jgi:hypothetical protein
MLLPELEEFLTNLTSYRNALKNGDKKLLRQLLSDGNERKLQIDVKVSKNS